METFVTWLSQMDELGHCAGAEPIMIVGCVCEVITHYKSIVYK